MTTMKKWFTSLQPFGVIAKKGDWYVCDLMCEVKQYEDEDLAVDWAVDTMKDYFGESEPRVLPYAEITTDTPEGNYITEE